MNPEIDYIIILLYYYIMLIYLILIYAYLITLLLLHDLIDPVRNMFATCSQHVGNMFATCSQHARTLLAPVRNTRERKWHASFSFEAMTCSQQVRNMFETCSDVRDGSDVRNMFGII